MIFNNALTLSLVLLILCKWPFFFKVNEFCLVEICVDYLKFAVYLYTLCRLFYKGTGEVNYKTTFFRKGEFSFVKKNILKKIKSRIERFITKIERKKGKGMKKYIIIIIITIMKN